MILQTAGTTATCLTGPSFTTIAANATQGAASQHVLSGGFAPVDQSESWRSGGTAGRPSGRPDTLMLELAGSSSGPISQASEQQLTVSGQPYTFLQGQVQAGVTGATVVLSDGTDVQATVADGSLVAWWPGSAGATAAHATSGSAVTSQQLTFTPLSQANLKWQPPTGSQRTPALTNGRATNSVTRSSSSR
jgi:hypothetical protein